MALITGLGVIVVSILRVFLPRILAEEMAAWSPSVIRRLIKFAVGRLPEHLRERLNEEWQSHVNEVPGQVGKFLAAFGFLFAAYRVSLNGRRGQEHELRAAYLAQLEGVGSTAAKIAGLIQCNETGPLFNELEEAREDMMARFANPDTPLTSIVGLSHERSVRLLIAYTDQITRKNAVLVKLLEELQRRQVR